MGNKLEIKLDKADRAILAELDKNCRIPLSALAKKTRKSRQSVEYRIRRLVSEGIITSFNAAINPHKMGYKIYKLYAQIKNIPEEKKRLFSFLRKSPRVYWIGECDGAWDVVFGVFAKSDYEFYALKNEILSEFGGILVKIHGDALLDAMQYPKMYFTGELAEPVKFGGEIAENELDELDHGILGLVVNSARTPITEIAQKVRSTPPTVFGRLKRMEKLGVITQYRISVDIGALGMEYYKAIFHLERYTKNDEKELLAYLSSLPGIQYFIRNLWDIESELVLGSYAEYHELIDRIKSRFPRIIRNVESVMMKTDEWTPGFRNLLEKG